MTANRKLTLFVVLIFFWALIVWQTSLLNYLNLDIIQTNQLWLKELVTNQFGLALTATCFIYFLFVATAMPGIFVLAVSCGYLFGAFIGSCILVLVGTLGACVPFFLAQFLLSGWVGQKFERWIPKIRTALDQNPTLYMLAMRLNPAIPFMVQNTIPGLLRIPLKVYAPTTLIGLTPPSIAYATFGSGLNKIFAEGRDISLTTILSPEILISVSLLSFLVFVPLILRVIKSKPNRNHK
jgi:uncharacterized membrane protein YdjX (TVP38/TMEM64 family)